MKAAYSTGFWCTNIGNGFFSLGTEYVLRKILGEENVTVVSDYQTYTTSYGKRLYPHRNQLEYISSLDTDCLILAGPVLSRYFTQLWGDILLKLKKRGIRYAILSAGTMKMEQDSRREICEFFKECPPYALSSRDETVYQEFGSFAKHAYNGICFSFFAPDYYHPASLSALSPYVVYNFDKLSEPDIRIGSEDNPGNCRRIEYDGVSFEIESPKWMTALTAKTDRFTDAIIYMESVLPSKKRADTLGGYNIIRTDHRFHPHFRRKIYEQGNSFVADLPYAYLNLYANAEFTLSDRVHACAVTLAYGHSAMLFSKTNRCGLLERVGAQGICDGLVKLDLQKLEEEKASMCDWLRSVLC